jgi:hypothetical protein
MKTLYKSLIISIFMLIIICLNSIAQSTPAPKGVFSADLQSRRIAAGTLVDVRFLQNMSRLTDIALTKDGMGISGGGSYKTYFCDNFDDSVSLVRGSVDWGNDIGDRFLFGYPKLIITPISATGGFCASTLMFTGKTFADLFRKGNEVLVQENQIIRGKLVEPIDLPLN